MQTTFFFLDRYFIASSKLSFLEHSKVPLKNISLVMDFASALVAPDEIITRIHNARLSHENLKAYLSSSIVGKSSKAITSFFSLLSVQWRYERQIPPIVEVECLDFGYCICNGVYHMIFC
ncbi:hypothetical protein [Methanobrevibacter sp.]